MEGVEYRISKIGREEILAFRKSERAAYNFIRNTVENKLDPERERPEGMRGPTRHDL